MNARFVLVISAVAIASCIALWRFGVVAHDDQKVSLDPSVHPSVDVDYSRFNFGIEDSWYVEDFSQEVAQFETVFWEPADTASLRKLIRTTDLVKNKTVLEIGTGTGLISLCCLQAGARRVVATDINPAAIANAQYNAKKLAVTDRLDTRLVPIIEGGAYSVIKSDETFDLIVSNPPWEDQTPESIEEFAFYDEGFSLVDSLLKNLRQHLRKGGKALLAYGNVEAIRTIEELVSEYELGMEILDDRNVNDLPENFLPGMLLEITLR